MTAPPNIYIIGSQCTGKTTLVDDLCYHFEHHTIAPGENPGVIKEIARTILQDHSFTRDDIRNSQDRALELQKLIVEAQFEAERRGLETHPWFISDRSAVDPIIYARKYAGKEAANTLATSEEWAEMRGRMAKSIIIVCEAGVDWLTDDGVRLMPLDNTEWLQLHSEFCTVLADANLEYHVLSSKVGKREERVKFVLEKWEEKRLRLAIVGRSLAHTMEDCQREGNTLST